MKKNDVNALRAVLFDTLEKLRDPSNPMELERAKTISAVADTVISTAKVEVLFARSIGAEVKSSFLPPVETLTSDDTPPDSPTPAIETQTRPALTGGTVTTGNGVLQHKA